MCVYVCVCACVCLSGWCFNAQAKSCKGERILFNLNLERALKLRSEERQCVCVCVCVLSQTLFHLTGGFLAQKAGK